MPVVVVVILHFSWTERNRITSFVLVGEVFRGWLSLADEITRPLLIGWLFRYLRPDRVTDLILRHSYRIFFSLWTHTKQTFRRLDLAPGDATSEREGHVELEIVKRLIVHASRPSQIIWKEAARLYIDRVEVQYGHLFSIVVICMAQSIFFEIRIIDIG